MSVYDSIKNEYIKFSEKNKEENSAKSAITKMNFLKKLEELATKNNLQDEFSFINKEKEEVINLLKEKGIQQKNN